MHRVHLLRRTTFHNHRHEMSGATIVYTILSHAVQEYWTAENVISAYFQCSLLSYRSSSGSKECKRTWPCEVTHPDHGLAKLRGVNSTHSWRTSMTFGSAYLLCWTSASDIELVGCADKLYSLSDIINSWVAIEHTLTRLHLILRTALPTCYITSPAKPDRGNVSRTHGSPVWPPLGSRALMTGHILVGMTLESTRFWGRLAPAAPLCHVTAMLS
jgi:hypothetical protein